MDLYFAMKAIIKSKNIFKHTKMLVLDNRVLMEKYLKSSTMVAFVPRGSSVDEGFTLRSVVETPYLEQLAVYRKGEMTPELLRCINMMKMIIDSTAL